MTTITTFCQTVELGGLEYRVTARQVDGAKISLELAAGPRAVTMVRWEEEGVARYSREGAGELEGVEEEEVLAFLHAWCHGATAGLGQLLVARGLVQPRDALDPEALVPLVLQHWSRCAGAGALEQAAAVGDQFNQLLHHFLGFQLQVVEEEGE